MYTDIIDVLQNKVKTEILCKFSKNKKYVLTGVSAITWAGYSNPLIYEPDILTNDIYLKNMTVAGKVRYCYTSERIDTENYVHSMNGYPNFLIPTIERAIIENIKYNLEFIDLGYFEDTLERYQHSDDFDYGKLTEVAKHFNVSMEEVDRLLEESSDYNAY